MPFLERTPRGAAGAARRAPTREPRRDPRRRCSAAIFAILIAASLLGFVLQRRYAGDKPDGDDRQSQQPGSRPGG